MAKLDHSTAVRRCADDLGHSPTRADYARWRRRLDRPRSVPSDQAVCHGRSWLTVLGDAGLPGRQAARFTTAQAWIQVEAARRTLGSPSMGDYDRWRMKTTPRPISTDVLLLRTGRRWSELFPAE